MQMIGRLLRVWILILSVNLVAEATQSVDLPPDSSYITYEFSGGRFGDQLLSYLRAKWLVYEYDLHLLYKPFLYSDQFKLHLCETRYDTIDQSLIADRVDLDSYKAYTRNIDRLSGDEQVLFNATYAPEWCFGEEFDPDRITKRIPFYTDWDSKGLRQELRRMVSPLSPISSSIVIPSGRVSVAIHYRVDPNQEEKFQNHWPVKSPKLEFYIKQLEYIKEYLSNPPMFVHIFTTSKHSRKHKNTLESHFKDKNIVFSIREGDVNDKANVLEDFFAMSEFDCIIHGDSNFSNCAAIIGDPMIEVKASVDTSLYNSHEIGVVRTRIRVDEETIHYIDRDPETGEITKERVVYVE